MPGLFEHFRRNFGYRRGSVEPNALDLHPDDIEVIRRTWQSISNPVELGLRIFSRIFAQNPHLKASFGLQSVVDEDLPQKERFRSHAQNFVNFLAVVFVNLDGGHEVIALRKAREIGVMHARIAAFDPAVFDPEYWMLFLHSAVQEISRMQRVHRYSASKVHCAWQLLLMRLIMEMKVSFYAELTRSRTGSMLTINRGFDND